MASENKGAAQGLNSRGAGNENGCCDLRLRETVCKFAEAWRTLSLARIAQALDGLEGFPASLAHLPHCGFNGGIGVVAALAPGFVLHLGYRKDRLTIADCCLCGVAEWQAGALNDVFRRLTLALAAEGHG